MKGTPGLQAVSTPEGPAALEAVLSPERLVTYRIWADGDVARALDLYALNAAVSEALYTPLQMLEVAMRNRFHQALAAAHGPAWFDDGGILVVRHQREQLAKARQQLARDRKAPTASRIVAELPLGFWTALLNRDYEVLWRRSLRFALDPSARDEHGQGLSRAKLATAATQIRKLRNRVAHHEPVLHWDLARHHAMILAVTGWLSPHAAAWTRQHERVPAVLPKGFAPLPSPGMPEVDGA